MPLISINLESKPKYFVTIGLILMTVGVIYIPAVLWVFDFTSTKYIQTEITLTKYPNLNETVIKNINEIQKLRLSIPLILAEKAHIVALVLVIGGGISNLIGLIPSWSKDEEKQKIKQKQHKKE